MPEDRATLVSVARQAGVSRQTVSNVLNAPEVVRPETIARVRAVIAEQGYRPHRAARQMRTRRSGVIAVRIEPVGNGVSGVVLDRFLHALTAAAEEHDHRVMLFTAADDDGEIRACADLVATVGVDAFLLTGTHRADRRIAWLREHGHTFVTFGRPWGDDDHRQWVDVDGAAGTHAATAHLLSAGHRRVAFVGWPSGDGVGDDRRAGWLRAQLEMGFEPGPEVGLPDGIDSGRAAAALLLDVGEPPTAFVCASDSLGVGVLTQLRMRGGAGAVVGFDDTPVASAMGMSSVRQPVVESAAACVAQLHALLDGQQPSPQLLAPELIVRRAG